MAPTSYIKWMEIWLIFAQLVPFTEVILLTIQESYRENEGEIGNDQEKETKKPIKSWTKIQVDDIILISLVLTFKKQL